MSEELKRCPFCGGEARIEASTGAFYVSCDDCGSCSPVLPNNGSIAAWNTRAQPEAAPVEPVAWLKEWTGDPSGQPRRRVDLTRHNEDWLEYLKPKVTPLYTHPPAAPTDALVEKVARLEEALQSISDLIGDAAQDDCENGVRWLNERAAAAYLKDFPATLTALRKAQEIIDAVLS